MARDGLYISTLFCLHYFKKLKKKNKTYFVLWVTDRLREDQSAFNHCF